MKLQTTQKTLHTRLQDAARIAAENKDGSPHRCVRLSAKSSALTIRAMQAGNHALEVVLTMPADVAETGTISVNSDLIAELLSTYPQNAPVDLAQEKDSPFLSIVCQTSQAHLPRLAAALPKSPPVDNPDTVRPDAAKLRACIAAVLNAASNNAEQPVLNGIHINLQEDRLTATATDGFRLSLARYEKTRLLGDPTEFTIPTAAARELQRLLAQNPTTLEILTAADRSRISFRIVHEDHTTSTLSVAPIPGDFPDAESHIPTSPQATAQVAPAAARAAASVANRFATEDGGALLISIRESKEPDAAPTIALIARAQDHTDLRHVFPLASLQGKRAHVALNPKFLLNALQPMRSVDAATFELTDSSQPVVLRNQSEEDSFTHISLIMPMHVAWDPDEYDAPAPSREPAAAEAH